MRDDPPILPAHIEQTIQAIAQLHAQHHREATPVQRGIDRLTKFIGRPRFMGVLTAALALWIGGNVILRLSGRPALDPPPFAWLEEAATLLALFITVLILTTQRREDEIAQHREQLTLELALLSEQKTAKIIRMLEELRRDSPQIVDRVDAEADALSVPADPQAVLDGIKGSHEDMLAELEEAATKPAE